MDSVSNMSPTSEKIRLPFKSAPSPPLKTITQRLRDPSSACLKWRREWGCGLGKHCCIRWGGNSIWKSFCGKLESYREPNQNSPVVNSYARVSDELFFGSDVKSYFSSELIATSVFSEQVIICHRPTALASNRH